jgi:hypothetical protein
LLVLFKFGLFIVRRASSIVIALKEKQLWEELNFF